jgi:ATP synthase F1 complex assembly factor 2
LVEWSTELAHLRGEVEEASDALEHSKDKKRFGIEEATRAANLETDFQTQMWGEVEDTHDVNKEDLRRQLGSVILLVSGEIVK